MLDGENPESGRVSHVRAVPLLDVGTVWNWAVLQMFRSNITAFVFRVEVDKVI
jgi:hypothetical protein